MYILQILKNGVYQDVELDDKFNISFNYTLKDFNSPSDIKCGYSKTITIYGTPHNNDIFSYIYNVGSKYRNFDPTNKVDCRLFYNGMLIRYGYLVITSITKKGSNITYKATFYDYSTKLLYDIKYDENGNERMLNSLNFGFNDEDTEFEYNLSYVMDSWSKWGELKGLIENEKWEVNRETLNNSIKQYMTPILGYSGYYSDFDSSTILWAYQKNDGTPYTNEHHPPYYINQDGELSNETRDVLGEIYSKVEEDKTYTHKNGWYVYKTERELHPFEAKQVICNRLPLGIDLYKTWETITQTFNIDDSGVRDKVKETLENTFMIVDKELKTENEKPSQYIETKRIVSEDYFSRNYDATTFDPRNEKTLRYTTMDYKCEEGKDYKFTFRLSQSGYYEGLDVYNYGISVNSPFILNYVTTNKDIYYTPTSVFAIPINLVRIDFTSIDQWGHTVHNYRYCPVVGNQSIDSEDQVKNHIRENIKKMIKYYHFNIDLNGELDMSYLFSKWTRDSDGNTITTQFDIFLNDIASNVTNVQFQVCSFTILVPTTESHKSTMEWGDIYAYRDIYNNGNPVAPTYTNTMILANDKGYSLNMYGIYNFNGIIGKITDKYSTFRVLDPIMLPCGSVFSRRREDGFVSLQTSDVEYQIQVSYIEDTETLNLPKISKDILLNSTSLFDTFIKICKMCNITIVTDNLTTSNQLKCVFPYDLYSKNNIIDITNDIDVDVENDFTLKPSVIESNNYAYSFDDTESYSDKLLQQKNPNYNVYISKFDYNINKNDIDVLEDVKFKVPTKYKLKSSWFNDDTIEYSGYQYRPINKGYNTECTLFYTEDDGELKTTNVDIRGLLYQPYFISQYVEDEYPQMCLFNDTVETVELDNTIVAFNGFKTLKYPITVGEDIPAAVQLNNQFCYYIVPRRESRNKNQQLLWDIKTLKKVDSPFFDLKTIPMFDNIKENGEILGYTTLDNVEGITLYDKYFSEYNSLIMNKNHKILKCKVRFNSYNISDLIKKVFYFDNAYWVINKFNNFDFEKIYNEVELIQIDFTKLKDI